MADGALAVLHGTRRCRQFLPGLRYAKLVFLEEIAAVEQTPDTEVPGHADQSTIDRKRLDRCWEMPLCNTGDRSDIDKVFGQCSGRVDVHLEHVDIIGLSREKVLGKASSLEALAREGFTIPTVRVDEKPLRPVERPQSPAQAYRSATRSTS